MSLKAFHIFFIGLSIILLFGFAVWLFQSYANNNQGISLVGGVLSMIAGIGLIIYGVLFLKKLKHVNFL